MSNGECVVLPLSGDPELVVHGMEIGGALLHSWTEAPRAYDPDVSRAERGSLSCQSARPRQPSVSAGG